MGVFTSSTAQVSDIGRSCGAIGGRPFCQMFLLDRTPQACTPELAKRFDIDPFNGGNYVTHPAYIMVFGPCSKKAHAPTDDAPVLPRWLGEVKNWSNLVCNLHGIPSWDADPSCEEAQRLRSGGNQQLDLGNVKQKATNMGRWIPRVHQLMLFFGTFRSGKEAKKKKTKKQEVEPKSNGGVVMVFDGPTKVRGKQYASNARPVVQLPTMSMHHWPARGTACTAVAARALIRAQQFAGRRVHDCMMLQFNVQNKNNNM